jgi:predicted HTH domain antitoxin
MPGSQTLPKLLEDEIDALIGAGYYANKSDVLKDAVRTLLDNRSNLKLAASVEMYKKGKVSLEKAAELAGMGTIEFKEVLINKGIERYLRADINDMKKSDQVIHKMK